jgi:hypothetical protein
MFLHLPIVILASLHPTLVADTVPKFDITRECQSEGGTKSTQQTCVGDENQARRQLESEWAQFGASDRAECYEETNTDGSPSYVEFLTCLEMARDVKKE